MMGTCEELIPAELGWPGCKLLKAPNLKGASRLCIQDDLDCWMCYIFLNERRRKVLALVKGWCKACEEQSTCEACLHGNILLAMGGKRPIDQEGE